MIFILITVTAVLLGLVLYISQKLRNITEEKKKIETRYDSLFQHMGSGVSVFHPVSGGMDFVFKDINASGEKIYSIRKQEVVGKHLTEVFPHVRDFGLFAAIQQVNESGQSMFHPDMQYEDEKLIGWRKHYIYRLPDGEIVSIYSDDTQQKLTELALLDFESRYRTLFNNANDAIIVHDFEGKIMEVNRVTCELLGFEREEFEEVHMRNITAPEGIQTGPDPMKTLREQGSTVHETAYRSKDGSFIAVEVSSRVVEYDLKPMVMTLARDIRERKKAEAEKNELISQLRHSQKMEAIGTLAGGIAHDFNNILQVIFGYIEFSLYEAGKDSIIGKNLNELMSAAQRARDLVQHILTFSRQGKYEKRPLYIQPIIKETLKLLRATLPATIEIRQDLDIKYRHVLADPTHIHQIMMNLCTNAYHAMREKGGILDICLQEIQVNSEDILLKMHLKPGTYLHLKVSDTGNGIGHEIIDKIFDPYFTTKPLGEGTGLGLSLVHGIVKAMDGHISVYSEPEHGTTFHIYIPAVQTADAVSALSTDESVPMGNEHILLVDDEEPLIRIEENFLKRCGYQVSSRISSVDALELFHCYPNRFDLVVTDMSMPNMTGLEMAKKMMEIHKDIPIILCTGFSEVISAEKARAMGIREYVMKPVMMKDLAVTVRRVLKKEKPDCKN